MSLLSSSRGSGGGGGRGGGGRGGSEGDAFEFAFGGDPLDVIKSLASADHLILSRSSFGYVAAILNPKGQVYFPSQFWHVPMKGWQIIRESNYE